MEHRRIDQFIDELNANMGVNYLRIEKIFNAEYDYPELDPLRDEICKCIICGLYQATITLTNHLLESSLKKCLAMKYTILHRDSQIEMKDAFKEGVVAYDSWNLNNTIEEAHNQQLITDAQKERLHKFRTDYRNAYSHAQVAKIFEDNCVEGKFITEPIDSLEKIRNRESDTILLIRDFLPIQGIAQAIFAQNDATPYFIEIDEIIRDMLLKLKSE